MIDIASQVKHNCNISDARYWGYYSPCGLLLRMRDLYKFERNMKPWEQPPMDSIGEWMQEREGLWAELEDQEFRDVTIGKKSYRPFDVKGINAAVEKQGYVYGAGYGNLLKPGFIFAEAAENTMRGKFVIRISGRELARDLSTSPAMIQGNRILVRQETLYRFYWSKFEEMKAGRCRGALFQAFAEYGIAEDMNTAGSPDELEDVIRRITGEEMPVYIHHEIGEASQRRRLGAWWKDMLMNLSYSRAELFLRGLKDVLSDTCTQGMLSYIINNRRAGSLAFYVSLLGGFRRILFPSIFSAYNEFAARRDWGIIERARLDGYKTSIMVMGKLKDMYEKGRISAEAIEEELIDPVDQSVPSAGQKDTF